MIPIINPVTCNECQEPLTKLNWFGWFKIGLNDFGFEVKVPVCNKCNEQDDMISGAY